MLMMQRGMALKMLNVLIVFRIMFENCMNDPNVKDKVEINLRFQ